MSLVGPRPEEAALVSRYTDDQRRRLAVKPGMTGPMQVSGRGDLSFGERLALELEYIEHYSAAPRRGNPRAHAARGHPRPRGLLIPLMFP